MFGCLTPCAHTLRSKYCTDSVFKPYVVRGELVHVDQSQYHTFSPLYSTQKGVSFKIYATADVPEQGAALFKAGSGRRMYITDEGMQVGTCVAAGPTL